MNGKMLVATALALMLGLTACVPPPPGPGWDPDPHPAFWGPGPAVGLLIGPAAGHHFGHGGHFLGGPGPGPFR